MPGAERLNGHPHCRGRFQTCPIFTLPPFPPLSDARLRGVSAGDARRSGAAPFPCKRRKSPKNEGATPATNEIQAIHPTVLTRQLLIALITARNANITICVGVIRIAERLDMTTTDQNEAAFLTTVSDQIQAASRPRALDELIDMISPNEYIGDLIKLDYDHADILVHDSHKMQVKGIPHGCLLIASRITPDDSPLTDPTDSRASLLLLRVIGTARLNSEINLDSTRFEIVQRSNDTSHNYDDAQQTDQFTLNLLRYSGIQCRILGTFRLTPSDDGNDWRLHFGADIDNFYAGQGMKIYKPSGPVLEKIVNYGDETTRGKSSRRIGRLRYSAAIKETDAKDSVLIEIVAEDFIAQRTALFGMTRTGKSNATKTIASALFNLRSGQDGARVGQLIFDPNGEYANENPQDQGCIRNLKYTDDQYLDDVHTYVPLSAPVRPRSTHHEVQFLRRVGTSVAN